MKNTTKDIFKFIIKVILTPFLIGIALIICVIYLFIGIIIVPIQTLRFLGLTTIAAAASAWYNRDSTNSFLEALFEFYAKYLSFFINIFKVPMAIWIPAEENKSEIKNILQYEIEVLSKNWLSSTIIFLALIFSFTTSFSMLGFKSLDFLNLELKSKIEGLIGYDDINNNHKHEFDTAIDSLKIRQIDSLSEINSKNLVYNDSLIRLADSVIYENVKISNSYDSLNNNLTKLESENRRLKNSLRNNTNSYKMSTSSSSNSSSNYKAENEFSTNSLPTYSPYGKGKGRLVINGSTKKVSYKSIYINQEYLGQIKFHHDKNPGCDAKFGLYKDLYPGTYRITVIDNNVRYNYTRTISAGNCTNIFI